MAPERVCVQEFARRCACGADYVCSRAPPQIRAKGERFFSYQEILSPASGVKGIDACNRCIQSTLFIEEISMNVKSLTAKAGLVLASCVLATAAFAQKTQTVDAGLTSVKLSSTFTGALESLGVTAGTVAPTRICDGTATFPITGGAIDLDSTAGNIVHSGGLTLEAGGTEARLESFIIDTTSTTPGAPVLTGLVIVNKKLVGRLPLFNIVLPPGFSLPLQAEGGFLLQLKGVDLTLTSTAAGALNSVYGLKPGTIPANLPIGTASVFAFLSWPK
jgi:hypothetical protein